MGSLVSMVTAISTWRYLKNKQYNLLPTKPKIWKHYIGDTTILDRSNVDCFLQHLNSQQPTIHVTMETEKDKKSTLARQEDLCRRG